MTWSENKKWQLDLFGKLVIAIVIAVVGAASAYFIDQRFQKQLAISNADLQRQLADARFLANRAEIRAQALETIAATFMETAYLYSNALESAFKDTYFRHEKYHGDSKGGNQLRYENDLHPSLSAILAQLLVVCHSASNPISEYQKTYYQAFTIYNSIENLPPDARWDPEWQAAKSAIEEAVKTMQRQANRIYKAANSCVDDIAHNKGIEPTR